jgi:deoxyribodipyrimidine photolyase
VQSCDPDGDYVRRWVPALKALPVEFIHCPWEAPATRLAAAGVLLGRNYPKRIVSLDLPQPLRCLALETIVYTAVAHLHTAAGVLLGRNYPERIVS